MFGYLIEFVDNNVNITGGIMLSLQLHVPDTFLYINPNEDVNKLWLGIFGPTEVRTRNPTINRAAEYIFLKHLMQNLNLSNSFKLYSLFTLKQLIMLKILKAAFNTTRKQYWEIKICGIWLSGVQIIIQAWNVSVNLSFNCESALVKRLLLLTVINQLSNP